VVSDCTIANSKHGIWARSGSNVFLNRVTIDGNEGNGVRSQGSGAKVHISNSMVVNNGKGLAAAHGGEIISLGNNVVLGNSVNGAPTSTDALK
jgi:hypothetical protein